MGGMGDYALLPTLAVSNGVRLCLALKPSNIDFSTLLALQEWR